MCLHVDGRRAPHQRRDRMRHRFYVLLDAQGGSFCQNGPTAKGLLHPTATDMHEHEVAVVAKAGGEVCSFCVLAPAEAAEKVAFLGILALRNLAHFRIVAIEELDDEFLGRVKRHDLRCGLSSLFWLFLVAILMRGCIKNPNKSFFIKKYLNISDRITINQPLNRIVMKKELPHYF